MKRLPRMITAMFLVLAIMTFIACSGGMDGDTTSKSQSPTTTTSSSAPTNQPTAANPEPVAVSPMTKWYQGGTLHQKSALDWQDAGYADKLATCADFVSFMWNEDNLRPEIASRINQIDDLRPFAEELVKYLDAATKRHPDPKRNHQMFVNQDVAGLASIGMVAMGWTKQ